MESRTELGSPHGPLRHESVLALGETFTLHAGLLRSLAFREVNVREAFTIVDASGVFFRASFQATDGKTGSALAYERMSRSTESPARITLVCAVLGRQKMLVVVQKATELGAVRIVPVFSDHSVPPAALEKEKPWAWGGQALRASRQCRRASVPEVRETMALPEALAAGFWKEAAARFFLDDELRDGESGSVIQTRVIEPSSYVLAVGPEGGWSARERDLLRARGAAPLWLGSRILRAETAVFAGLSVLQHRLGDLGPR
ncbi:MAG TPA: RsmE family RNA methyltransferase [Polyangiaceae bacterium]